MTSLVLTGPCWRCSPEGLCIDECRRCVEKRVGHAVMEVDPWLRGGLTDEEVTPGMPATLWKGTRQSKWAILTRPATVLEVDVGEASVRRGRERKAHVRVIVREALIRDEVDGLTHHMRLAWEGRILSPDLTSSGGWRIVIGERFVP